MIFAIGFLSIFNFWGHFDFDSVNVSKFDSLRLTGEYIVLDVRTQTEYDEGHIENAILIDFKSSDFEQKISGLDKTAKYLVYCRRGHRSRNACNIMSKFGLKTTNLIGGITEWISQGKEVIK